MDDKEKMAKLEWSESKSLKELLKTAAHIFNDVADDYRKIAKAQCEIEDLPWQRCTTSAAIIEALVGVIQVQIE